MRTFFAWSLLVMLSTAACATSGTPAPSTEAWLPVPSSAPVVAGDGTSAAYEEPSRVFRLVTLGDAYTQGTDTEAPKRDSWPGQLVAALERSGMSSWLWNLAESTVTSGQVVEEQLGQVESLEPDVVTVQVGANDIITRETQLYRDNMSAILDELLRILPPERIFAITTPDHTLTDWGSRYRTGDAGSEDVRDLNDILVEVATERGIAVIDIGPVNVLVASDTSLVVQASPPVPYPTAKQYAGWVEIIGPYVYQALSSIEYQALSSVEP